MKLKLSEEPMTALPEYARIPITFTVDRVLDMTACDDGPGAFALSERRFAAPDEKDYDASAGDGPAGPSPIGAIRSIASNRLASIQCLP